MAKRIVCSECGAAVVLDGAKERKTCIYCGSRLDLSATSETTVKEDVAAASRDAARFQNSLMADFNGQKISITDLWNSLTSNSAMTKEKKITFQKNLKKQIRFCVDAYRNMTDEAKYELGDFCCAQMESIIDFRLKNNLDYLEDLDEIDALIKKQEYDRKARGIFQIKAILTITKRIKRIRARRAVMCYMYSVRAMETITRSYNSKIEPLKAEYKAVAASSFSIRKNLKDKINSLELEQKREIESLGMKKVTKEYNRYVKKFKIDKVDPLQGFMQESKGYVPQKKVEETSTVEDTKPAEKPIEKPIEKPVEKPKDDYSAMSIVDLLDALNESLNKLNSNITRSETERCKKIKAALASHLSELNSDQQLYLNAVLSSVDMVFQNEQPLFMSTVLKTMIGNVSMQSNTLKSKLS